MRDITVRCILLDQPGGDAGDAYKNWERDIKAEFEGQEDIQTSARYILESRGELNDLVDESLCDGRENYRNRKMSLQQKWLDFFEEKLFDRLERALAEAKESEESQTDLYIIAMGETFICDYELEILRKDRKANYVNPLYEPVVRKFLGTLEERTKTGEVRRNVTNTLLAFTRIHSDVILFPGTVWWKQWQEEYPRGVIFNSAPVFYCGACRFLWEKQYISKVDGLEDGQLLHQWMRYRLDQMKQETGEDTGEIPRFETNEKALEYMEEKMDGYFAGRVHKGILSSLAEQINPYRSPLFAVVFPNGAMLSFGVDICLDNVCLLEGAAIRGLVEKFCEWEAPAIVLNSMQYSGRLGKLRGGRPDIHIITASWLTHFNHLGRCCTCKCDKRGKSTVINEDGAMLALRKTAEDSFFLYSEQLQLRVPVY